MDLAPAAAGLLTIPLALGFLLPPRPLGAVSASQRGVDVASLGGGSEGRPAFTIGSRPEAYTIKDWVKAFQVDPEPARHAGQPVRVTGFVHRDPRLSGDWILVARFVVTCCAVDAQPVGLPVRGGVGLEPGQWVLVEGSWAVAEAAGDRRAVIAPRRVLPVWRPDQPYLY